MRLSGDTWRYRIEGTGLEGLVAGELELELLDSRAAIVRSGRLAQLPPLVPGYLAGTMVVRVPIEEAVGVIKNVRQVRSVSQAGRSDVTLEFNWGTRMDYAVLDVREKLDTLELPKDAKRPVVLRFDPSSDPILRMGLALKAQDDTRSVVAEDVSLKRLRRIAEDLVQKPLEAVGGVAAVKISGGLEDEVQVLVDLHKLAQQGLTLESISTRLKAENVNLSGGRVEQGASRYLVRTLNQFRDLDQMRNVILVSRPTPGGVLQPVYLRDVAEVRSGYKEREAVIRIGGNESVEIDVYKEGDGNTVETAQVVQKRLETLRKSLPADVELKPLYDQSVFIESAIDARGEAPTHRSSLHACPAGHSPASRSGFISSRRPTGRRGAISIPRSGPRTPAAPCRN